MSANPMSDLALRWVVTILFGVSITTYLYILAAQRPRLNVTVSHLLHLAMSVAMILMVWGIGMSLPTTGTIFFFVLAGLWFAHAAGRMPTANGDRLTNAYYAVMMGAMAWMFAVMNGGLPGQIDQSSDHVPSGVLAMDKPEPEMMPMHEMSPAGSGTEWVTTVNWILTVGFAVVTLYWACSYISRSQPNSAPRPGPLGYVEPLYQLCTAAGTALMFGALL